MRKRKETREVAHSWQATKIRCTLHVSCATDILFLKYDCSTLRQSSNPVCGFSMMEQVRLCAVWPTENWPGSSSMNHIQGLRTEDWGLRNAVGMLYKNDVCHVRKKLGTLPRQPLNLASYSCSLLRWPPAHSAGRPRRTDLKRAFLAGGHPLRPKFQNCRSRPCRAALTFRGYFSSHPLSSHPTFGELVKYACKFR